MCFIIMAGEMRITLNLPVGDLSHFWPKTDVDLAAAEKNDEAEASMCGGSCQSIPLMHQISAPKCPAAIRSDGDESE